MYEDNYLDCYWEDQVEPYYGEDYNLYEEREVYRDLACEDYGEDYDDYYGDNYPEEWDYA